MVESQKVLRRSLLFPTEQIPKMVYESQGGNVGIPDVSLTFNMLSGEEHEDKVINEWRKEYDCHFLDLQIDVNPNPSYDPQYARISGTLNPNLKIEERPIIKDLLPKTKFVNKSYQIEGNFVASVKAGFEPQQAFDLSYGAGIKGELRIGFTYKPMIAEISSGVHGSGFHCNFVKARGLMPTGGLGMNVMIHRPRHIKDMKIAWDISVKFAKKWRGSDEARIPTNMPTYTILKFNESKI